MSYTVLARRYRSGTFDEVIGQDHVAQTLKKAIESERVAHAYLFCGTRGVGKTSMARILAKALNCEKAKGPTTQPCGQCNSCQAVARGEDIDVIEIDAASNTGVDNVRDLIANAAYRPARARFKIYIIDEVHMLSKAAFNALLKIMEEPPGHVKFILATTEPEKVLPTILSRCQRYDFRNIPTREIAAHLKDICHKEKIKAEEDALLLVAKAGAGSMRDALSLLDRLLSIGEKQLTAGMIEQLLGLPKAQLIYDLAQAIGEGDTGKTLQQADALVNGGLSPDALIASLIEHLRNLLILRTCGPNSNMVEVPGLSPKQLYEQAQKFEAAVLTQDIVVLEELRRHLRQTQAGRALLDATLVRLAMAEQFTSVEELLGRLSGSSPSEGQKKKYEFSPAPVEAALAADPSDNRQRTSGNSTDDDDDDLPQVGRVWDGPSLSSVGSALRTIPQPTISVPAEPANLEPVDPRNLPEVWRRLMRRLQTHGPQLLAAISTARLAEINSESAVICFPDDQGVFSRMLEKNGKKDLIRNELAGIIDRPIALRFEVAAPAEPEGSTGVSATPAARRETPQRPTAPSVPSAPTLTAEMKAAIANDPFIKAIITELGAEIRRVE